MLEKYFIGETLKKVIMLMMIILFLFTLIIGITSSLSNPIPVPTLIMDREYIIITINCFNQNEIAVNVTGIYTFKNVGHKEVMMYFPVPLGALKDEIKVFFNDREMSWEVSEYEYDTVIGRYPMIRWKLSNLPKSFEVRVYYKYSVKRVRDSFKLLYAMATGRYLNGTYSKQCLAEVKFKVVYAPKDWIVKVSFVPPPSETFGVGYESEVEVPLALLSEVTVRKASRPFRGMDRDLLVTIIPQESPELSEKWVEYYPNKEEVEVKFNVTSNNVLKVLVKFTFKHGGFKVNVVEKKVEDSKVLLGLSVLQWTGPSIQVITTMTVREEYKLESGKYTFFLKINDKVYFSQEIVIGSNSIDEFRHTVLNYLIVIACVTALALLVYFKFYRKRDRYKKA